jgi:cyclopropane fatty-acyl-phospholipid synthase-like methyltransferase
MATIPTSACYFADAERYLRGNHRIQLRREIVAELIGTPRNKRILDLGCGNGAISLPFAHANEVLLVDNSAAMISAVRAHAASLGITDYEAVQSDVAKLQTNPVDIVLAIGLLAHVDNVDDVFEAIARCLRPSGIAVVQLSDRTRLLNRVGRVLTNLRGRNYQPMSMRDVLQSAEKYGFQLKDERSHLVIIPGLQRVFRSALVPYDRFVRRHPHLAKHGTDTLLLLQYPKARQPPTAARSH